MASPEDIGARRRELFGHGGARTRDGAAFPNAARAHESACSASRWRKILIPQIGHSARERGGREVSFRFGARGKGVGGATNWVANASRHASLAGASRARDSNETSPGPARPIRADFRAGLSRNDPRRPTAGSMIARRVRQAESRKPRRAASATPDGFSSTGGRRAIKGFAGPLNASRASYQLINGRRERRGAIWGLSRVAGSDRRTVRFRTNEVARFGRGARPPVKTTPGSCLRRPGLGPRERGTRHSQRPQF